MLVNTSFNVRGEPIVCTPADAYRCFLATDMDVLVMGRCVVRKADQPPLDPAEVDRPPGSVPARLNEPNEDEEPGDVPDPDRLAARSDRSWPSSPRSRCSSWEWSPPRWPTSAAGRRSRPLLDRRGGLPTPRRWRPIALKPVYLGLTLATWPIGWVVSHLALAVVYYGVITPIALVFRLIGRDAMNRRFDRDATTYWEPYDPDRGLDHYLRQF